MIDDKIIRIAVDRLVLVYNPVEIYLFGSYAWGNPDKESDLDILIVVERSEEKPYKRAIEGMRILRGMKIPKDILVYTKEEFEDLSNDISTLCYKIKKEGVKLYEAA